MTDLLKRVARGLSRVVLSTLTLSYLLVSRTIAFVAALYMVLYFFVGTSSFKSTLQDIVAATMPGTITVATVRWGPAPWELRIADGRVFGVEGEEVIQVDAMIATIDLGDTLSSLYALLTEDHAPFIMQFDHVALGHPRCIVEVREDGWVGVEHAFINPSAPDDRDGIERMTYAILARSITVVEAGALVITPEVRVAAEGINSTTDFALNNIDLMKFHAPNTHIRWAEAALMPTVRGDGELGLFRVTTNDLTVEDFVWKRLAFSWRRARGGLGAGQVDAYGALDTEFDDLPWRLAGDIDYAHGSPIAQALFGDGFDGPFHAELSAFGTLDRANAWMSGEALHMELGGVQTEDVSFEVVASPAEGGPGPVPHGFEVTRFDAAALGGRVSIRDGAWAPAPGESEPTASLFGAAVTLDEVELGPLIAAIGGSPADGQAPVDMGDVAATATLSGVGRLGGRLEPNGRLLLETHAQAMTVSWPGTDAFPLEGDYQLSGTMLYRQGPPRMVEGREGLIAEHALEFSRVAVDERDNRLRLKGTIDLDAQTIDLEPYLRFGDVRRTARKLGLPKLGGRLVFKASKVKGTLDDPIIKTELSWSNAQLGTRKLGRVRGDLTLSNGLLSVQRGRTVTDAGAFVLDGQVRLLDPDTREPHAEMPFQLTHLDAKDMDLTAFTTEYGPKARLDLDEVSLRGTLRSPLGVSTGEGTITARNVVLGMEPVRRLHARIQANADKIALTSVGLTLGSGERVRGALTVQRRSGALHGRVEADGIPWSTFRTVRRAMPDLAGTVGVDLTLGGTLDQPGVIGRVSLRDIATSNLQLGDADIDLFSRDGRVDVSSASFFPGLELSEGSGVDLDGLVPKRVQIAVQANKARLSELVPALKQQGVEITTSAKVRLGYHPQRRRPLELDIIAAPEALAISLAEGGTRYVNQTQLKLAQVADVTRLSPVAFVAETRRQEPGAVVEQLEICGEIDDKGALDVRMGGLVDLAFMQSLEDAFSVVEGGFRIGADRTTSQTLGERCLSDAGEAVLRVTGNVTAPVFSGRLEAANITLVPRGLRRQIRLDNGFGVLLRPGEKAGTQQILSPAEGGLRGEIDDGSFVINGGIDLDAMTPVKADLELLGTDLFYTSPGEFSMTFNPGLSLQVRDFDTATPDVELSGTVVISEGRYNKSFDTFARALGGAISGQEAGYSRSLTTAAPWLSATRLALDIVSREFEIKSDFPLGKTDIDARLDLSVAGTIGRPEVFRRIDLLAGGTLTYDVFKRDFEVIGGAIDFDGDTDRPTIDVTAQTEVTYLARSSTNTLDEAEKEVLVTLRIRGKVPNLEIELDSDDPSFDQADLQSLILTGRPRRELDRSQGYSLVAADLGDFFRNVLKAPFVQTASVGVGPQGDVRTRIGTCFGKDLCFRGTAVQETTETEVKAGFTLQLGDDLICDGTARRRDATTTLDSDETYEARCRYRIPLD